MFKVGDKVICTKGAFETMAGFAYVVTEVNDNGDLIKLKGNNFIHNSSRFRLWGTKEKFAPLYTVDSWIKEVNDYVQSR